MQPFEAVLRDLPDEQIYLATYQAPALLLEPFDESESKEGADTGPPEGYATDVLSAGKAQAIFAGTGVAEGGAVHREARVAWLVKSDRNPFPGLISVGRGANNDLIFPHPSVSKVHAIFSQAGGSWFLEDRKSTNGTFLDGVLLPPHERVSINDGSSVRIGDAMLARFFMPESFYSFCGLLRQ